MIIKVWICTFVTSDYDFTQFTHALVQQAEKTHVVQRLRTKEKEFDRIISTFEVYQSGLGMPVSE